MGWRDDLFRQTQSVVAARSGAVVSVIALNVVLANSLGAKEYGIFSFSLSFAELVLLFASLGWPMALLRFTAEYRERQDWPRLLGLVTRSRQIGLVSSLFFSGGVFLASTCGFEPPVAIGLRFTAMAIPMLVLAGLARRSLQGLGRPLTSILSYEIALPATTLVLVLALSLDTATGALWSYVASATLVLLLTHGLLRNALPRLLKRAAAVYETPLWMMVALPMVFGSASRIVIGRSDTVILGFFRNMSEAGVYTASSRITLLLSFALLCINVIAAPRIAAAHAAGRSDELREVFLTTWRWSVFASLPLFVFVMIFPDLLLGIFGSGFKAGTGFLRVLACGGFAAAITGPVGSTLLMTGRERVFAVTFGLGAVANILGNFAVVERFGALGVSWVTATTIVFINGWQLIRVWPLLRAK